MPDATDYEARGRAHYLRNRPAYIERSKAGKRRRAADVKRLVSTHLITHPCGSCGEDDAVVLEFRHRPGTRKSFDVRDALSRGFGPDTVASEIAKCDVVCCNCRRRMDYRKSGDPILPKAALVAIPAELRSPSAAESLLTMDEAAGMCARHGLADLAKLDFWRNATKRGRIPCAVIAKRKRFRLDVVQGLIDAALVESRPSGDAA